MTPAIRESIAGVTATLALGGTGISLERANLILSTIFLALSVVAVTITIAGVNYIEKVGIIAVGRAAAILSA